MIRYYGSIVCLNIIINIIIEFRSDKRTKYHPIQHSNAEQFLFILLATFPQLFILPHHQQKWAIFRNYFWPHKRISGPALAENFHDVDFTLGRISQTGSGEAKALFIPLSSSKKTNLQSCGGHKINFSCFPIFTSICLCRT